MFCRYKYKTLVSCILPGIRRFRVLHQEYDECYFYWSMYNNVRYVVARYSELDAVNRMWQQNLSSVVRTFNKPSANRNADNSF